MGLTHTHQFLYAFSSPFFHESHRGKTCCRSLIHGLTSILQTSDWTKQKITQFRCMVNLNCTWAFHTNSKHKLVFFKTSSYCIFSRSNTFIWGKEIFSGHTTQRKTGSITNWRAKGNLTLLQFAGECQGCLWCSVTSIFKWPWSTEHWGLRISATSFSHPLSLLLHFCMSLMPITSSLTALKAKFSRQWKLLARQPLYAPNEINTG